MAGLYPCLIVWLLGSAGLAVDYGLALPALELIEHLRGAVRFEKVIKARIILVFPGPLTLLILPEFILPDFDFPRSCSSGRLGRLVEGRSFAIADSRGGSRRMRAKGRANVVS